MPKETNKILNPYYFELLKFLVVYKFRNRISNEISTEEREELATELHAYNTADSLNRIFSKGNKRRQNFNVSSLTGLCNFLGHEDWNEFIKAEYIVLAEEFEGILYNDLDEYSKQQLHSLIILRVLKQVEKGVLNGLEEYIKLLAKQINQEDISEHALAEVWNFLITCINIVCKKQKTGWLDVLYKIAENVELGKGIFDDLSLPSIFTNEFFERIASKKQKNDIDKYIEKMPDSLEKNIIAFYRKQYSDEEIQEYYQLLGVDMNLENIKEIRWQTAETIFRKLNNT